MWLFNNSPNAHKDYSIQVPIQIKVFKDRIQFWNPGQLPNQWTAVNLTREHPSMPFNPDIAAAFFRAGLIESWGRGTIKMISETRRMGLPLPIFEFDDLGCRVEFRSSEKGSVKRSGKSSEKILEFMRADAEITIAEIAQKLNISTRAVEKQIAKLKAENKIVRKGSARAGYWEVL